MVNFGYFEQKDGRLIRVSDVTSGCIPIPPGPGEKPWLLLCWSESGEEPQSPIDLEEAKRKGLIF